MIQKLTHSECQSVNTSGGGTYYIIANVRRMIEVLGQPSIVCPRSKNDIQIEWVFRVGTIEEDKYLSIHDWKKSNRAIYQVSEWLVNDRNLHIGGTGNALLDLGFVNYTEIVNINRDIKAKRKIFDFIRKK